MLLELGTLPLELVAGLFHSVKFEGQVLDRGPKLFNRLLCKLLLFLGRVHGGYGQAVFELLVLSQNLLNHVVVWKRFQLGLWNLFRLWLLFQRGFDHVLELGRLCLLGGSVALGNDLVHKGVTDIAQARNLPCV